MRKFIFNFLVRNTFEKFIVIACVYALVSLCSGTVWAASTYDAGLIPCSAPTPTAPIWGKLVLTGNTVTCYYALGIAQPVTWTQYGPPQTINFINNPILVGMYTTSANPLAVTSGTLDNFSISPAPVYRLTDYDVGSPALMGSANLIGGVWNLTGGGAGLSTNNTSDQCNFQSWLVWGDCTVICRFTSLAAGACTQKIGIMIRDGFNSGSDWATFCSKGSTGIDFLARYSFVNNPDLIQFVAPPAPGVRSSVAVGYGLTGGTTYTLRP